MPAAVVREETVVAAGGRPMPMRFYAPRGRDPDGALLLVQGLHFAGPDDPRLDRFAAILAAAGLLVGAPFLPDFARLVVGRGLVDDTARAFDALERHPGRPKTVRPGIFSISFGSLPALRLAASAEHRDRVGGLVVFGGYGDFADAIRFCLRGDGDRPHDPLNRPVVFLNLLEHLEGAPADPDPVCAAWERFVRRTWGRPEMKVDGAWQRVAREEGGRLVDPAHRAVFELGCGLADGGLEAVDRALARAGDAISWLDPRPHLGTVTCPTWVVHGRDDDVIPWTHAALIGSALPPAASPRVLVTGLYGHTGRPGLLGLMGLVPAAAREIGAMVGILDAIARAATNAA
jgi:pimeloyl-ACP methyl ester carboxylesterase